MHRSRCRGEERGRTVAGEWMSWGAMRREVGPDHPSSACFSRQQRAACVASSSGSVLGSEAGG